MTVVLSLGVALLLGLLVGAQDCFDQTVQLVDETDTESSNNGTVRYCLNGVWRTLCRGQDKWQAREAIVTCRQLGYEGGFQSSSGNGKLTSHGNRMYFKLSENCDSTENSIEECGGIKVVDGCGKESPGALRCLLANCTDRDIRLVGGSTFREGRVEVCMSGRWGTVCNSSQAGIEAICLKLGFPDSGVKVAEPAFVSAGAPIHTCDVSSDGINCSSISNEICNHTMDLWVRCSSYSEIQKETLDQTSETHEQPVVVGALGAIIGVLVALQAVTLTILGIVIYHRKRDKQSSQEYTTKRNESYTFTQPKTEIDASKQTQSNSHVGVEGDQGSDGQDPTILTQQDKLQKPRPYLVALGMEAKKPPSKMSDWKVTSEAGIEGDDLNAESYANADAFMNKDRKRLPTETYPYSTVDEDKSGRGVDDFYEAEQHTYSVVDAKAKKKARHQKRTSPKY